MPSESTLAAAERFFHDKIPLTRSMGLRVVPAGGNFAVEAPVALNSNHLQTAFGGSINAVATLAGYGFLWLALQEEAVEMVVAESSIRFLAPVRRVIHAECIPPEPQSFAQFQKRLREKGRARISLEVVVLEDGQRAAEFHGSFVAFRSAE